MYLNKVDDKALEVNTTTMVGTVSGGVAGSKSGRRESDDIKSSWVILDGEVISREA